MKNHSTKSTKEPAQLPLTGYFAVALVRDVNSTPEAPTFGDAESLVKKFAKQNRPHTQLQFVASEAGVAYIRADHKGIDRLKDQPFVEKKSKGGYANIETIQPIPIVNETRIMAALGRDIPHQPA